MENPARVELYRGIVYPRLDGRDRPLASRPPSDPEGTGSVVRVRNCGMAGRVDGERGRLTIERWIDDLDAPPAFGTGRESQALADVVCIRNHGLVRERIDRYRG